MKRVALYARVSTIDKDQDPELQLSRLREYARAHDWEITVQYVDHASGANWNRPEFLQLMEDVRRRKFDAILVTRVDRFMRSERDLLNCLQVLKHHHIAFITIDQIIDTSTAIGNLLLQLLGAIAEFEREQISERVKEGMQKAKREGKQIGRKWIEIENNILLKAFQEGKGTIRGTRDALGKIGIRVSVGTVHRMLKGLDQKPPPPSPATAMASLSNSTSSVQ